MVNHISMANTICKSWNKEKLLSTKIGVQSCLTALRAAPEQLSIPFNKLPYWGAWIGMIFRCPWMEFPMSSTLFRVWYYEEMHYTAEENGVQWKFMYFCQMFLACHIWKSSTQCHFFATWPCWNFSSRYMT